MIKIIKQNSSVSYKTERCGSHNKHIRSTTTQILKVTLWAYGCQMWPRLRLPLQNAVENPGCEKVEIKWTVHLLKSPWT